MRALEVVAGEVAPRLVGDAIAGPSLDHDRATVDAFHAAGLAFGAADHGEPGPRPIYHPNYYGGFLLDPDGNNVEAVCHAPPA